MARKKNINKVDKRTTDYKDSKLEKVIRINTSYLVEVSEKDLEIIKKYSLENFIVDFSKFTLHHLFDICKKGYIV